MKIIMTDMEIAYQASPTLAARRTRSSSEVVENRERMAAAFGSGVKRRMATGTGAVPFFDELLTVDADPPFRRFPWIGLALAGATIVAGLLMMFAAGVA